ncbi:hypothetical protein [Traorella massiliensis]|uniref:hypothetical protein n=1 Tax=Traorella massiliensis TaxID=1903263 RepID=UPI0008F8E1A9|nr:hypothetical protein [Traorella massiliensis]
MIHISLEGIVKTKEDENALIDQIEKVCHEYKVLFEIDHGIGSIYVCPCGVIEVNISNYYAILKTNTALVGPGYHAFVCELFDKIQKGSHIYLSLDDECDYLEDHDLNRIKDLAFYPYMHRLMDSFSKMKEEDEATYAWDDKSYLPVAKPKSVITPFGYIYANECQSVSLQEACSRFYIWNEVEKDALFYRNSALVSLWCDCLFENSLYDEAALNLAKSICIALEKAHELDKELPLPIDEYQMLCRLLNRENQIFDVDQYPKGDVGYRKNEVFYVYGNWFIYFQGNAIQSFDGHTMILKIVNEEETLLNMKITGYKSNEKMDFAYRYLNTVDSMDSLDFEDGAMRVKSVLHELHDGTNTLYLQAQCIKENEMLMINAECSDMSFYQQAIHTLENMQMIRQERSEVDVKV